jgi:hypothetical protein
MSAASCAFTYVLRKDIVGTFVIDCRIRGGLLAPLRIPLVLMLGSGPWQIPTAQLIGALFVFSYSCLPRTAFWARAGDAAVQSAASSAPRITARLTMGNEVEVFMA